ncbi:MAG TPA: HU family DNA-binding protein [Gemmatales bacterium]|nr:HU family DNA-binding protein [Gemmatales bacterium]HMP58788.1 HU family DNA-binding protein [Gemmatales bacterium]
MTKKEIVKEIADRLKLTQLQTKEIVQLTFDAIIETLVSSPDHRIELRNFGVFQVKRRAERSARNPRTNEKVHVPAKNVVTFKPGKRMEELVRGLENVPLMNAEEEDEPASELAEETLAGSASEAALSGKP